MAVSLPFTFANGTVADATQVNANFNALATVTGSVTPPLALTGDDPLVITGGTGNQAQILFNSAGSQWHSGSNVNGNFVIGASAPTVGNFVRFDKTGYIAFPTGYIVMGDTTTLPTIGVQMPSSLISNNIFVRGVSVGGDVGGHIGLNAYLDGTNPAAATAWRFLDAGAAAGITTHGPAGSTNINFFLAEPGNPGDSLLGLGMSALRLYGSQSIPLNNTSIACAVNVSGTPVPNQRVTVGAADSGGAGFRMLVVPNG